MTMDEGQRVSVRGFSPPRWLTLAAVALGFLVAAVLWVRDGDVNVRLAPSVPSLAVSEDTVHGGDVIQLDVHGPRNYTWGLPTSLQEFRGGKWKTVYTWAAWLGKESGVLEPIPIEAPGVWPSIGFEGDGSFMIRMPDVDPGDYRITIEFIKDGPAHFEDRTTMPAAHLSVVP